MTDVATNFISKYVQSKGVKVSVISRATGISDGILRRSLSENNRPLRADEFLDICSFLDIDPVRARKQDNEYSLKAEKAAKENR